MKKHYLITFQQKWHERTDWQTANAVTDKDPGVWLAEMTKKHEEVAKTVLVSAVQITQAGYKAAKEAI